MRHFKGMFLILMVLLIGATEGVGVAQGPPRDFGGGPLNMGRLRTIGFEAAAIGSGAGSAFEGSIAVLSSATATIDTGTARSGTRSLKINSGVTAGAAGRCSEAVAASEWASGRGFYARTYVNIGQMPTVNADIFGFAAVVQARLTTTGKLQLFASIAGVPTQIGSDSVTTLATGTWYRVELFCQLGVGSTDACELRLDGITVASGSSLNISDIAFADVYMGFRTVPPGVNTVIYYDDFALNDSQGATQNSWPDSGKIVMLYPISDNQRGSWTGGVGGTTNLWDAVNNTPPIGTATETDSSQIESADSSPDNATDEYRPNMTSYTTAGIVASDTITLCQAVVDHGEDSATGTKTGTFLILSNPAQVVADAFTFGNDIGALGTWPSNWTPAWGAAQVAPSVVLGTSPVLRIRKVTASTAVGSVDFMGINVEYVNAATTVAQRLPLFGAGR